MSFCVLISQTGVTCYRERHEQVQSSLLRPQGPYKFQMERSTREFFSDRVVAVVVDEANVCPKW